MSSGAWVQSPVWSLLLIIFEESWSEARENGHAQGPCATEGDDIDEDYNKDEDNEDKDDDKNEEEFCYMDEAEDDD